MNSGSMAWREAAKAEGFQQNALSCSEGEIEYWERKGSSANAPGVYLSAGIHGDEPAGVEAVQKLFQEKRFAHEFHWYIFPCLNPTGLRLGTRENDRGIDLNRDYLVKRSWECRLHSEWFCRKDRAIQYYLSLHEDWEASGCYLYEISTLSGRTTKDLTQKILQGVSKVIPLETAPLVDNHELSAPGLIIHSPEPDEEEGWPEAIFVCKQKSLLSYTFETPSRMPIDQRVAAHVHFMDTTMALLLK